MARLPIFQNVLRRFLRDLIPKRSWTCYNGISLWFDDTLMGG
jgi:hypothetical protein